MGNFIKINDIDVQPNYWQNICEMQQKQVKKGISKYGQRLEENTELTAVERITYLQEELIDGLMYCEHLKDQIKKVTDTEYMLSLLEKQEPMQMEKVNDYMCTCPKCGHLVNTAYKHCCECGQVLRRQE